MKYLLRVPEPLDEDTAVIIAERWRVGKSFNTKILTEYRFFSGDKRGMAYRFSVSGSGVIRYEGYSSYKFYVADPVGIRMCKGYFENQITVDQFLEMFCNVEPEQFEDELMEVLK